MTFDVRPIRVNDAWRQVLIVTTDAEQAFNQSSFTETVEGNGNQYLVTYSVHPNPIRHFPPGYDNSNPDTHKYWFLLLNQQTNMV